ncbi:MAG: phosphodiester glycosidase family protein, partial [Cyanobacteria bacterium K_DeepCast_0m_m1_088]|nr:phosphodiester glycosidase family protein [Cyanobacteria bacterium K_DeepCast_0m_m1_088]
MPPLPALAALLPGIPLTPPPPLPAPVARPPLQRRAAPSGSARLQGSSITINGLRQQALWLQDAGELWLPLEVLEGQLGVSRSSGANGSMELEWFGQKLSVSADRQRSLDDEVAVPVSGLLEAVGVAIRVEG